MYYRIATILPAALLLLALAVAVRADSPPPALRSAITGGGGALAAEGYRLIGAIGQPVAGTLQAGGYRLTVGVITGSADVAVGQVYLPLVRR
jgi:hypothetical protein